MTFEEWMAQHSLVHYGRTKYDEAWAKDFRNCWTASRAEAIRQAVEVAEAWYKEHKKRNRCLTDESTTFAGRYDLIKALSDLKP